MRKTKTTRVVTDEGKLATEAEYDPRTRSWYKDATIDPNWSSIYRGASTDNWMFTRSRTIHRATDINGAYHDGSSSDTRAAIVGVVGMDYDMEKLHEILYNVRYEVFDNNTEVVLSLFYQPKQFKDVDDTLALISSSDVSMYTVIDQQQNSDNLIMPAFLGSYFDENNKVTTRHEAIDRSVMQATIASYKRALKVMKHVHSKDNDYEIPLEILAHNANTTHYYEHKNGHKDDNDGDWMISVVQLDNILHGASITIATKSGRYYEHETVALIGTVIATLGVITFIAVVLYVGDSYFESCGFTTTALSLCAMFACFMFVIGMWINETDSVISEVIQSLSTQLNHEILSTIKVFLSIPPLLNRFNYALLQTGALEISMFNNSAFKLHRLQLQ